MASICHGLNVLSQYNGTSLKLLERQSVIIMSCQLITMKYTITCLVIDRLLHHLK